MASKSVLNAYINSAPQEYRHGFLQSHPKENIYSSATKPKDDFHNLIGSFGNWILCPC